jgi:amino acid/amide ABC transporter membrane protein 2, HAAT family (TC 3.A.1.4.-)
VDDFGHDVRHAGALYAPQVGIINPSEMSTSNSIEIAIWTAIGGAARSSAPSSAQCS